MLTSEDILNLKEPPNELLEIHLYQVLEIIRWRYFNNQISKEKAEQLKIKAIKDYDKKIKMYEFKDSIYKEQLENRKKTEMLRIKFRKNPTIELAKEIISLYSGEMF